MQSRVVGSCARAARRARGCRACVIRRGLRARERRRTGRAPGGTLAEACMTVDAKIEPPTDREERARTWIHALTDLPDRFAGTSVERLAGERIAAWMRGLGGRDVALEPTPGAPRAGLVLALHTGVALLGLWRGGVLGVLLTAIALWSFRNDLRHGRPRLSKLLPAADSVNVVGRLGAAAPTRRVVLSAHIDSAQAGVLFARALADRFAALAGRQARR